MQLRTRYDQPPAIFNTGKHGVAVMCGTGVLDHSQAAPVLDQPSGWYGDEIEFSVFGIPSEWLPNAGVTYSVFPTRFATHLSAADLAASVIPPLRPGAPPASYPLPAASVGDVAQLGWALTVKRPAVLASTPAGQRDLQADIRLEYHYFGERSRILEIGWTVSVCA